MSAAPRSEGGRAAGVHLEVEGQPHQLDFNLLRADPCFQVRGRRFRARFPAHSRCERPFCPP